MPAESQAFVIAGSPGLLVRNGVDLDVTVHTCQAVDAPSRTGSFFFGKQMKRNFVAGGLGGETRDLTQTVMLSK